MQSKGTLLTTQKDGIELKAPLITARRKHAIKFILESLRAIARTGRVFLLIPRNARLAVYLFKTNSKVIARLKSQEGSQLVLPISTRKKKMHRTRF